MAVLGLILAVASSSPCAADESAEAWIRLKEMYPATKIERVQPRRFRPCLRS
jgi:hypothetical protein